MPSKPWTSKTIWVALFVAAAGFIPGGADFISKNPELFATGVGLIFTLLRVLTKGKIVVTDNSLEPPK